jgi:hypothetical protein
MARRCFRKVSGQKVLILRVEGFFSDSNPVFYLILIRFWLCWWISLEWLYHTGGSKYMYIIFLLRNIKYKQKKWKIPVHITLQIILCMTHIVTLTNFKTEALTWLFLVFSRFLYTTHYFDFLSVRGSLLGKCHSFQLPTVLFTQGKDEAVHTLQADTRKRGVAPLILNLGTWWRLVVNLTPWPLYDQEWTPALIE